jgi:cytochrome c oxidase assembly protein subunit 15
LAKLNLISKLALCATFFALGVIALGAFTRLIDAGLGCPDWPGCYGHITVPTADTIQMQYPNSHLESYKAWAEMIHRYFVSGLSLFILSIVFVIFKNARMKSNILLAIGLIALLAYQIILGRWTVTWKLLPVIVTQHLLGGFFILSLLWLIYLNNNIDLKNKLSKINVRGLLPWCLIALIILLTQIFLGAWTSTNYASLSCLDFPFCSNDHPLMTMYFKEAFNIFSPIGINYEGGVLPTIIRQTIQMTHRMGALILTIYILIFTILAFSKIKKFPELMKSLYLIWGLLCAQLCIGITNVIFKLPLFSAISHNIMAAILLLSVITLTFKLALTSSEGYMT